MNVRASVPDPDPIAGSRSDSSFGHDITDLSITSHRRANPSRMNGIGLIRLTPTARTVTQLLLGHGLFVLWWMMTNTSQSLGTILERGFARLEGGDYQSAAADFASALAVDRTNADLVMALANAQRLAGHVLEARATLATFVASDSEVTPEQCYSLGTSLLALGAPQLALGCLNPLVSLEPSDPAVLAATAGALRAAGRPAEGWELIKRAIALDSNRPAHLLTAAQVRHSLGDMEGAFHWLDRAEKLRPAHGPTRVQRAYTMLLASGGSNATGWKLLESRPLPHLTTLAHSWHGQQMNGGSILVMAEQGVGDQFQFVRFVSALKEFGAGRILVQAHPDAVEFLNANGLNAISRDHPAPATEWYVPMLSLPYRLSVGSSVRTASGSYLTAERSGYANTVGTRRLGLVWAGNPEHPGSSTRDINPDLFSAVLELPGTEWIGLQAGSARGQAPASLPLAPCTTSWSETASLLVGLDGLVTVDTGIAHLAGALGIPTWILVEHVPDWRWGLSGDRTQWYDSVRLVRQPHPCDWAGAIDRLHDLLANQET